MDKYALLTILIYSVIAVDGRIGMDFATDEIRDDILDVIDTNVRSLMTSGSVQTFFKKRCAKNPEVDSYKKTQEATDDLMSCVSTVFDSTSLSDLSFTRGKDKKSVIFERYCSRSPDIMRCVRNFASILSVCFDKGDKNTDNNTSSIISKIMYVWLLYSCHGNKLMSYLKMGGSKCVESKKDALHRCGEPIDNYLKNNGKFSSRFPSLMFEKSQCGMISNTRQCVVDELNKCERPTAAVDYYSSLFDVFRDMSPCNHFVKAPATSYSFNYDFIPNFNIHPSEEGNIILTLLSSMLASILMIRSFDFGSIRQILIPRYARA